MSEPLRAQELSKEGIGASEIAAALGLSPYQTPLELWMRKVGEAPEDEDSDAGEWGLTVEPALRRWYERRSQTSIYHPKDSLFHAEVVWMRSTPDGIALRDPNGEADRENWDHGFEGKNTSWRQAHRWGEPGTDDIPLEHILQCQQGMAVTGLASWRVVAAVGGMPPAIYRVDRDDELIEQMVVGGTAFWQNVLDRTPPPIDGSEAWGHYIARRYPFAIERPVVATAEQEIKAAKLREVRQRQDAFGELRAQLENELKAGIADHSGMQTSIGTITWRPSKPRSGVDYKAAFVDLAARLGMDERARLGVELAHTREHKAARPFCVPRAWLRPGSE
jgi:putative phage-type endonuclease